MTTPAMNLPVFFPVDDDKLEQQITLLAGQINAANHRLLKLIAEFDRREAWGCGGTVRSCAHWLNWKCGIALGAAREKVRVAHALEQLPLIDAAFSCGEISFSKVRAMTRVATADNEDFLLRIAEHGTASHVEQVVAKYKRLQVSAEDLETQCKQEQEADNARKLVYYQDSDGMWVIHARLPAEAGALVVKAIEAVATPEQKVQQDMTRNDEENVSAETFSHRVDRDEPGQFQQLLSHTRADALVKITEQFLACVAPGSPLNGLKGSERCQVMLHVDINSLQTQVGSSNPGHTHCNFDDKHPVSLNVAQRLACDASLVTVLEDADGQVLNIGRRSRTVPANISRALKLRDKTCRFPGCCETRYVDAHHILHWADGGETSLDNLVTLCRYHHRQLHNGSFSIATRTSGDTTLLLFFTQSGAEINSSLFPQFPNVSAETSCTIVELPVQGITPDTCISKWQGEDCDYAMAVDALLQRDVSAGQSAVIS
jgi:hypothetical protein